MTYRDALEDGGVAFRNTLFQRLSNRVDAVHFKKKVKGVSSILTNPTLLQECCAYVSFALAQLIPPTREAQKAYAQKIESQFATKVSWVLQGFTDSVLQQLSPFQVAQMITLPHLEITKLRPNFIVNAKATACLAEEVVTAAHISQWLSQPTLFNILKTSHGHAVYVIGSLWLALKVSSQYVVDESDRKLPADLESR